LAVGALWAGCWFEFSPPLFSNQTGGVATPHFVVGALTQVLGSQILCWMLVALAALDLEHFWLPDVLTVPGIALGFIYTMLRSWSSSTLARPISLLDTAWQSLLAILAGAGLVLLIRLVYWVARRQEGMGLGDAKLMAMLGAWLGFIGSMESFALSVVAASAAALVWLAVLKIMRNAEDWTKIPLPLGSFLCFAAVFEVFYPQWLLRP
jgi:leader peptidase (prepilin peptidase)/N-methyltransferase